MSTQAAGGGSAYKFNHTGAVSPMHTTLSIFSALTLIRLRMHAKRLAHSSA